jgi:transcription antitermination factor NusG
VHIALCERSKVFQTDGILNFVHYLGKPAVIKEDEINLIKHYLLEKDVRISLISKEGYAESTKIRVNHGVFMGKEGTVLRNAKKKIFVKLESLGQVMVVEFPVEYLSHLD